MNYEDRVTKSYIENALGSCARIATGSYAGTGVCGAEHPNSLTFDFVPKLVIVGEHPNGLFLRNCSNQASWGYSFLWIYGQEKISVMFNSLLELTVWLDGNTLYWYGENAPIQCNFATRTDGQGVSSIYDYIAIG